MSPTSTSLKVLAAKVKLNAVSSVAAWSGIGLATVGASLLLLITISKLSLMMPPLPSSAVTVTVVVPTSAFNGVPVKVRVAALKLSQPEASEV